MASATTLVGAHIRNSGLYGPSMYPLSDLNTRLHLLHDHTHEVHLIHTSRVASLSLTKPPRGNNNFFLK